MSLDSPPPQDSITTHRWRKGTLRQHLALLLPALADRKMEITSTDLDSNASFVNYVRHHCLTDPQTGTTLNLVEKSIRKLAFIGSQEARLHRQSQWLAQSTQFQHPLCYGVIETPWESLIFTSFVSGRAPRMYGIASHLARGIAELEAVSHRHLSDAPRRQRPMQWCMDFFRPWFLMRSRFNFSRYLRHLRQLERTDARFEGLAVRLESFGPWLARQARAARSSPRCICHMDYLRKNLFVNNGRLLLIDWSEVKIGRIGFDGGSYLSSLFRRTDMPRFLKAREDFITTYRDALEPQFDPAEALRNLDYLFLLQGLWHGLRPETIAEYRAKDRMDLLKEKYQYLLSMKDTL